MVWIQMYILTMKGEGVTVTIETIAMDILRIMIELLGEVKTVVVLISLPTLTQFTFFGGPVFKECKRNFFQSWLLIG